VVKFNPAPRLSRTAALLRTCRQVHEEARGILYGENAFHFERTDKTRGHYWDEEWKEIGYKDVRRFLEGIGPDNIARMRFVSLRLTDATPMFTPKMDATERRYQNDPVLHHILRLIGSSGVVLERFAVAFGGRSELTYAEVPFVRAFTSIKTRKLIKGNQFYHTKVLAPLYRDMEDFMRAPKLQNVSRKRQRAPKMEFDSSGLSSCGRNLCGCQG